MKKTLLTLALSALAAVFTPVFADDDYTFLYYTGTVNGNENVSLVLAQRGSDGFLAGEFLSGLNTFIAIGHPGWQEPGYMSLCIYDAGFKLADIEAERTKSGLSGEFINTEASLKLKLTLQDEIPTDFENPFIVPSLKDFKKFTAYSIRYPDDMSYGRQLFLAKTDKGFDFVINNNIIGKWGTATLEDMTVGKGRPLPFKGGKITYKDDFDTLKLEIFRTFAVAWYDNVDDDMEAETNAAYSQGLYAFQDSGDEFQESWVQAFEGVGDEEYVPVEYAPVAEYTDVAAIRKLINNAGLWDLTIPVDLSQTSKPNIDLYFRSIAAALPGGLLGEALKAANGKKTSNPKTQWTIDMGNGYVKASVPRTYGKEGVELCYWKGANGRDIVGVNFQYDSRDVNEEYEDERESWLTIFFMYDPKSNTLSPVCCCGFDPWANWQLDEDHSMFVDDESGVWSVRLPRKGKTIEFLDINGNVEYSCEWAAEIQWFAWG